MTTERTVEVEVPPGIHDGQRIRLSGEGHAGMLGGRSGDLYVLVRVRRDEQLVRDGNDILSALDLTMTQAALGGIFTVPTLDGDHELDVKPGAQPGDVQVLARQGDARAAGLRARRPPDRLQRLRAAAALRRAARPCSAGSRS